MNESGSRSLGAIWQPLLGSWPCGLGLNRGRPGLQRVSWHGIGAWFLRTVWYRAKHLTEKIVTWRFGKKSGAPELGRSFLAFGGICRLPGT